MTTLAKDNLFKNEAHAKSYIRAMANIFGGRHGINIVFTAEPSMIGATNGDTIYLRAGDFMDVEYRTLIEGIIDHEVGHIRHSDFKLIARQKKPLKMRLMNALEDVRMETKVKAQYAGAVRNLKHSVEMLYKEGVMGDESTSEEILQGTDGAALLHNFVLLYARYHFNQDKILATTACNHEEAIATWLDDDGLCKKIKHIISRIQFARNTGDVSRIVDKLLSTLKSHLEQQQDDAGQSEQQDNKDAKDDNTEDGEPDTQAVKEIIAKRNQELQDGIDDTSHDDFNDDQYIKDIHEALHELSDSIAQAYEEKQNDALEDDQNQGYYIEQRPMSYDLKLTKEFTSNTMKETMPEVDIAACGKIKMSLQKLLQGFKNKEVNHRNKGRRINKRRLHLPAQGKQDIFIHEQQEKMTFSAVSLLVDKSYSMIEQMKETNDVAYNFTRALQQACNIDTNCWYYSSVHVQLAKDFRKQPEIEAFNQQSDGTTPTGEAIIRIAGDLINHRYEKKNMFVITDGFPDNMHYTSEVIESLKCCGVNVFGIIIGEFEDFYEKQQAFAGYTSIIYINDVTELNDALCQLLNEYIL